jgi:5-methylthioadenosine/S-adenosylhomocysteine deaminase
LIRRAFTLVPLLVAFACTTATPPLPSHSRERADLLITGGALVPIAGPNIPHGSIAIRDGKIIALGPSPAVDERFAASETLRADGMAVLPGFVNAHTHAPMVLFRGIADDRDLMDWLQNFIFPAEKNHVDAEFVRWGTRLALAEMIRTGTTTFADMYYFEADIARETRAAGVRGVLGETLLDFPAPDNKTWEEGIAYVRKFVAEFRGDSLIVPAIAPHAPYTVSRQHLEETRRLATELGVPLLIHLAETEDEINQVAQRSGGLRPVPYLESIGFLGDDVLAAHSIWITSEDIQTLASRGVGVAHCPESNMMLASGVAPVPAMLDAGVELGLGTDGPAGSNNNLDMIEEMASAARLHKITRKDPKALSARQVLEMATLGGARALGLADRIGTLQVGKAADIILIDLATVATQPVYSLESAIVYAASGDNVATTIVNGKVLMRDRRLLTLDEPAILREAAAYRDKIVRSLVPAQ